MAPTQKSNKDKIEKVQRRAARFVLNNFRRKASVSEMLHDLNKAAGPDELHGKLLKNTAKESALLLHAIFQCSIDSGEIPEPWKKAIISPVYKKSDRSDPANYRPVSLTCISCKILEHIINRHILDHLDKHNILADAQHGFRKRRSCETQLLLTCHDLASVVNNRGHAGIGLRKGL